MKNSDVRIRKLTLSDVPLLRKLARKTFYETFSAGNSFDNLQQYLDTAFTETRLKDEINNYCSEFFFAETGKDIIGYLKVNYGKAQNEFKGQNSLEIERIYVLQEYQGKKAGSLLLNKAIKVAHQRNAGFIWLGVWEKNLKAIRFYNKNGFIQCGTHSFNFGDEKQIDLLMKLEIDVKNSL